MILLGKKEIGLYKCLLIHKISFKIKKIRVCMHLVYSHVFLVKYEFSANIISNSSSFGLNSTLRISSLVKENRE